MNTSYTPLVTHYSLLAALCQVVLTGAFAGSAVMAFVTAIVAEVRPYMHTHVRGKAAPNTCAYMHVHVGVGVVLHAMRIAYTYISIAYACMCV